MFLDKLSKGGVRLFLLQAEHFAHRRVGILFQLQLPSDQAAVEVFPRFGVARIVHLQGDLRKVLPITGLGLLLHNLTLVDILLQREENLHRIDRLEEVVGNLRPDGLVHQVFGLVFRDHHHGKRGTDGLDLAEGFQSGESGHVFVEQDEVVITFLAEVDGIAAVGSGGDFVAALFEEDAMGFEEVDFVVDPEKTCAHREGN